MALSLVMTSWVGTSSTCSIMFILAPMRSNDRHDEMEARPQGPRVAPEPLDRPFAALRHLFDGENDSDHRQHDDDHECDQNNVHASPPVARSNRLQIYQT